MHSFNRGCSGSFIPQQLKMPAVKAGLLSHLRNYLFNAQLHYSAIWHYKLAHSPPCPQGKGERGENRRGGQRGKERRREEGGEEDGGEKLSNMALSTCSFAPLSISSIYNNNVPLINPMWHDIYVYNTCITLSI